MNKQDKKHQRKQTKRAANTLPCNHCAHMQFQLVCSRPPQSLLVAISTGDAISPDHT